jgi:5'-nucleotidase (lipoprotein e(P4) family)
MRLQPFAMKLRQNCISVALFTAIASTSPAVFAQPVDQRENLNSVLWMQKALEYRYSAEQAYAVATAKLQSARNAGTASVEQEKLGKFAKLPVAIIMDLDETALDNSAYQGWQLKQGKPFDQDSWLQWASLKQAKAIPGSVAFAKAAARLGFKIFYVTNRECPAGSDPSSPCPIKKATMENMASLGFPSATDPSAFLLKNEKPEWTSDKTTRRSFIAKTHRIVMLLGDDLNDFLPQAEAEMLRKDTTSPAANTYAKKFSERWFVLSNPIYGSWERTLAIPPCTGSASECYQQRIAGKYGLVQAADLPKTGLKVATWNLEWLIDPAEFDRLAPTCSTTRPDGSSRDIPCNIVPKLKRTEADLKGLQSYAKRLNADVIALQEVDGAALAAKIFPGYNFCFTKRIPVQNVGFAIRKDLPFRCEPDYVDLGLPNNLVRWGVDMTLFPDSSNSLRFLGVHLKSGCPGSPLNNGQENCTIIASQVPILERWMDARATEGKPYLVMGDFNRRFSTEGTQAKDANGAQLAMFPELNDGDPPESTLTNVTDGQVFKGCDQADKFTTYIDQIVLSKTTAGRLIANSFERLTYDPIDANLTLSDHCPVAVSLKLSP